MIFTTEFITGMAVTLLAIAALGLYAGRKVKSAAEFSSSMRQAGWPVVTGTIVGTLVSGASTIGTAQLAFQYGFSAWWFTLGAGIACAILAVSTARRLYESSVGTIPQYLVRSYGAAAGPVSSLFTSLGIFFSMISQVLAFNALMGTIFHVTPAAASVVGIALVLCYVLFGGVWGVGLVGIAKIVLLYLGMGLCGGVAFVTIDGISGLNSHFPPWPWFSIFGRGVEKDLAAGFSLLVGILSTQTYAQAIGAGKTFAESRKGALISAVLIPPLGIGGILVGLFMRANFPAIHSSEALPLFVVNYLPPFLAGVVLATLLITVVGGWAGLTLGISTMLTQDLYQQYVRPRACQQEALRVQRIIIVILAILAVGVAYINQDSLILGWAILSMGLRGCTALCPLLGAMFFPRYITPQAGVAAVLLGPLTNVVWYFAFPGGMDPLYPGLAVSMGALVIVSFFLRKKGFPNNKQGEYL